MGKAGAWVCEKDGFSLHFPSLLSELSLPMFPQDPAQVTLGGFILLAALRADCAVFTALP